MSATAEDIIFDAFQMLGVYSPTETVSDVDAQTGRSVLNDMLDSWSNESLSCYAILEQSAPLVVMKASYTIGPGGDFNMVRPLKIIGSPGSAYVQDTNGNNYGIEVVDRSKWNMIANRSSTQLADFPDTMFYDPQFPLGIINIIPFPTTSYTMFWDSYLQLTEFASLTDPVILPPGYKLALGTNLAVALKPYFVDGVLDPVIIQRASTSLGNIKRTNMRPMNARFDKAIVSNKGNGYNIYTDRSNNSTY